jgi:hypothetical protein
LNNLINNINYYSKHANEFNYYEQLYKVISIL